MKRTFKKVILSLISTIVLSACLGCSASNKTILRYQKMEEGVSNPTTIEELQDAVKKYQDRVADIQLANQEIGIWYKMLGTRYLDNKMYGLALDSFEEALKYYPVNQNLYYYVGVCAGYMSKTAMDYNASGSTQVRYNYLKLAEDAYLKAINLDDRYERAWYGLGVIYEYELDEHEKAVNCFEHALDISTKSIDTMFHLGRAYYCSLEFNKALEMYDRIISTTKSSDTKAKAEELKKQVLDAIYE